MIHFLHYLSKKQVFQVVETILSLIFGNDHDWNSYLNDAIKTMLEKISLNILRPSNTKYSVSFFQNLIHEKRGEKL